MGKRVARGCGLMIRWKHTTLRVIIKEYHTIEGGDLEEVYLLLVG